MHKFFNNKKLGIIYNPVVKNSSEVLLALENLFSSKNLHCEKFPIDSMKTGMDFVFVIGGDGTLLKAARFYAKDFTPVFGINLGRLGFLSQTNESELAESVEKILQGHYKIEDRLMLISTDGVLALNDFVIKGSSASRTSRFQLSIDGKFVCDYLADGLIVSTPTGSTAYGLSAGGPVLSPILNAVVIVPICPHTLTARPIVVPSNEKITISTCETCSSFVVVADGQDTFTVNDKITIEKSKFSAKLALLDTNEFYSVLRNKLHWGVAPKG